ncbi:MAG: lipoyl synthase [Nitrospinota bacterium]|nr:lipoyl synthase [Nitrospinota bacterium]
MIKPDWLKRPSTSLTATSDVRGRITQARLNTVCRSARCPNMGECYSRGTATFMILGDVCSRDCGFCAVPHGRQADAVDPGEPARVAAAAKGMKLEHVVVTSVTRDDLPDGGASVFADTIHALRHALSAATVEVLTPDFQGDATSIDTVAAAGPDVFNHNMETVRELYRVVRPQAKYDRSLEFLSRVSARYPEIAVKSGMMVGLGETTEQVIQLLKDLHKTGCRMVTIGQYLRPSKEHLPVVEYVRPEVLDEYARLGEEIGIEKVFAGPLVRSSYMAGEVLRATL